MKPFLIGAKRSLLALLAILLVGAGLRFYRLQHLPLGFYWDEAAIVYNSWSLAVWNRDEYGLKLPVSFRSFGDYKAPLIIYALGAVYKITGLHPEYLRLITSVCGLITIGLTYVLARSLVPRYPSFALISAFLMAVTPWAVHFSRLGVEAQLALTLVLLGMIGLIRLPQNPRWLYVTVVSFVAALYAYHSAKIFIPLIGVVAAGYFYRGKVRGLKRTAIIASLIGLGLAAPFIKDNLFGSGFERGKSLIIFADGHLNSFGQTVLLFGQNVAAYLNPSFWVGGRDYVGLRHGVPGHGVLFYSVALSGLVGIVWSGILSQRQHRFMVGWFLAGLAPAVISYGNPHALRSLLSLPAILILAASGVVSVYTHLKTWSLPVRVWSLGAGFLLILGLELYLYLRAYFGPYASASALEFQYGYQAAVAAVTSLNPADDKVIMTSAYGQPYIYTLLYRRLTPQQYQFGALANYEFKPIDWAHPEPHRYYVGTPQEISPTDPAVIQVITIPGTTRPVFVIAKT